MICRLNPGSLEVRTVLDDVSYEVDLDGEKHVLNAALNETGKRLALTLGTSLTPGGVYASQQLVLIDLPTGGRRVLHDGWAQGPVWFPDSERLAFSNGTAICVANTSDDSTEELFCFSKAPVAPTEISIRPDGGGLALLKWVGDDKRIGVVDLDSGRGRILPVSCFNYSWWDANTILYVLGSGLKLLDIATGKSKSLLRDLKPLAEGGALDAIGEGWAEAVRAEGSTQDFHPTLCAGDRVYFGAVVAYPVTRRSIIPFLRRTTSTGLRGVLSMTRERSDLRLHLNDGPTALVAINNNQTLAAHLCRRNEQGWLENSWVFVGEGVEKIPADFGPLPRASSAVRGDLVVGAFARHQAEDNS